MGKSAVKLELLSRAPSADSPPVSHFSMTRSMILAILAFSLLIIVNLTVFGFLGFGTLSRKVVTQRLMQGVNEARHLINLQMADQMEKGSISFSKQIAPRLRGFSFFQAVVVLDRQGRVLHREEIRSGLFRVPRQDIAQDAPSRLLSPAGKTDRQGARTAPMIPVQQPVSDVSDDTRLALEFDAETFDREVEALRAELKWKLMISVLISLLLLGAGLAYVIWVYKRNQVLQFKARTADRLAYVGTLSSGLAHEIRNPLNSMNMNIQLIQEELEERGMDDGEDISQMLNSTRNEIRRLEKMVSSFLAYARPTRLQVRPIKVNDLVKDTLHFLDPEIRKSNIQLKTNLGPNLPLIPLDEGQVKQALINIIQNGVQVLEPGQEMEISTRIAGGDKILIVIRDEGPGISPEELRSIFKVFYSTKRGGTGLGLPTAQRIAELHNGGIKAESEMGKGTSFTFILPMEGAQE